MAEIALSAGAAAGGISIFEAAATAKGKVAAEQALVGKVLLGAGKGAVEGGGGELLQRGLEDIAEAPLGPDKELAAETVTGVLDDDEAGALRAVGADGVPAQDEIRY